MCACCVADKGARGSCVHYGALTPVFGEIFFCVLEVSFISTEYVRNSTVSTAPYHGF